MRIRHLLSVLWSTALLSAALLTSAPVLAAPPGEVTMHQDNGRTVREYRIEGQLYAIEIIENDQRTVLIDQNGNGNFQRQKTREDITPPKWVMEED